MYGVRCEKKIAVETRKYLIGNNLLDNTFLPNVEERFIIFPIKEVRVLPQPKPPNVVICESITFRRSKRGQQKSRKRLYIEKVNSILSPSERDVFHSKFDLIGSIAILEIDESIQVKGKQIGEILLELHSPSVKTVVRKVGRIPLDSEFRIQEYEFLAGKETMETIHKERGMNFKVVIHQVFFSSKISNERKRICDKVEKGERIFVPFCGIGPFVVSISKFTDASSVVGLELNKVAFDLACENAQLNKCKNVRIMHGDVTKLGLDRNDSDFEFERMVVPMPRTLEWEKFVIPILRFCAKPRCVIHLYEHIHPETINNHFEDQIKKSIEEVHFKGRMKVKLIHCLIVGSQHSKRISRVCFDFEVIVQD